MHLATFSRSWGFSGFIIQGSDHLFNRPSLKTVSTLTTTKLSLGSRNTNVQTSVTEIQVHSSLHVLFSQLYCSDRHRTRQGSVYQPSSTIYLSAATKHWWDCGNAQITSAGARAAAAHAGRCPLHSFHASSSGFWVHSMGSQRHGQAKQPWSWLQPAMTLAINFDHLQFEERIHHTTSQSANIPPRGTDSAFYKLSTSFCCYIFPKKLKQSTK